MNSLSRWFVPVLLSAVALVQMKRSLADGLTPWKGGGFGMFSTADSGATRFVRIYLERNDSEGPTGQLVEQPSFKDKPEVAELIEQIRAEPSEERILLLTRLLAAQEWHTYGASEPTTTRPIFSPPEGADAATPRILATGDARTRDLQKLSRFPVAALRLEVWRLHVDGGRDAAVTKPIARLHLDRKSGAHTFRTEDEAWKPWES